MTPSKGSSGQLEMAYENRLQEVRPDLYTQCHKKSVKTEKVTLWDGPLLILPQKSKNISRFRRQYEDGGKPPLTHLLQH